MAELKLTMAVEHYDRHLPLLQGQVRPDGIMLDVQLTAIPVFPPALFSQSQMYVNADVKVQEPRDLIGKRVALRSYQTTLSVLAKGDLQHEYGVGLDQVTWVTSADEPVAFQPPKGVDILGAANCLARKGEIEHGRPNIIGPGFLQHHATHC